MRRFPFLQLDVFAHAACMGNPLALIVDWHSTLDQQQMQRVANWTNLSETAFIHPLDGLNGYGVRIFTPHQELPFAGHPTIGAAHAALHFGLVEPGRFIQRCGVGDIEIRGDRAQGVYASVDVPVECTLHRFDAQTMNTIFGATIHEPRLLDVGPKWLTGYVRDVETLYALQPNATQQAEFELRYPPTTGTTLYAVDEAGTPHVRSFAPNHGIAEDPVCGSGNLCVAHHLRLRGVKGVGDRWVARQGKALGRDGQVQIELGEHDVLLGSHALIVFEGEACL